jgi:hypothetical protein
MSVDFSKPRGVPSSPGALQQWPTAENAFFDNPEHGRRFTIGVFRRLRSVTRGRGCRLPSNSGSLTSLACLSAPTAAPTGDMASA